MAGPHLPRSRTGNPEAQVHRQIHSWRAAVRTGPPQPPARRTGPRSKHSLVPANSWPVPRSLARHLRRPRLRAKSFRDYRSLLARYVRRTTWRKTVWGIFASGDPDSLQRVAEPKALGKHDLLTHAVLFSSLRQAVRWKLLLTNPAEDVHLPRQPRRRFTVFDVGQAKQFIAAMSGHQYEALFALALTTGIRPSNTWRSPGRISNSSAVQ